MISWMCLRELNSLEIFEDSLIMFIYAFPKWSARLASMCSPPERITSTLIVVLVLKLRGGKRFLKTMFDVFPVLLFSFHFAQSFVFSRNILEITLTL